MVNTFNRNDGTFAQVAYADLTGTPTDTDPPDFFINAAAEYGVSSSNSAATNASDIQAALNAASTASGRATVVLPSGTLQISATMTVPAGVTLRGQGMYATTLLQTAAVDGIWLNGTGATATDMQITVASGVTMNVGVNVPQNSTQETLAARLNIDSTVGGGTINNGYVLGGSTGGYFNRFMNSRVKSCGIGVLANGSGGLEALLYGLNVGTCTTGIELINQAYVSLEKCETNSCTGNGFLAQNSNFEAADCLMDSSSGADNWLVQFTSATGMPVTGWYMRMVNCRGSGGNSAGIHVQNTNAATVKANVQLIGCSALDCGTYGIIVTGNSTPNNTNVAVVGCSAVLCATVASADGFYFNFVRLALAGNFSAYNGTSGSHTADGFTVDTGCTGRSTGNSAVGNTAQQVNILAASAVLSFNDDSTNTRTVAQLPSAVTAGANSRAYVTDANAITFSTVVAGGGVNVVPVYSDGTNWRIG